MVKRWGTILACSLVATASLVSCAAPVRGELMTVEERHRQILGVKPVPCFEAYLDRTYYTREEEARLHVDVAFVPEDMKKLYVEAVLWDGPKLILRKETRDTILTTHTVIPFPLTGLKNGRYTLVAHLRDKRSGDAAGGKLLGMQELSLAKLPPAVDEVKVDRERRVILVNGKPFLVRGIWAPPVEDYEKVKAAGFNTVVYAGTYSRQIRAVSEDEDHFRPDTNGAKMILEKAAEFGLRAIPKMTTLNNDHPAYLEDFKATIPKMTEAVAEVGRFATQHQGLLGYRVFDEPYNRGGTPEACDVFYDIVKKADPYHLPIMLFSRYVGFDVRERSDLVGCWGYDYLQHGRSVIWRLERVRRAGKVAKRLHLPFIYGFQVDLVSGSRRNLTPPELRCLTYQNLVSDATGGITWFAYSRSNNHPGIWEELTRLNGEIKQLTPILLTESPACKVSGTEEARGIHVSLKEHKGRLYLITLNGALNDMQVRFTLSSIAPSSTLKVLFEDRTIRADESTFSDRFAGYGTHVYEMKPKGGNAIPHEVTVSASKLERVYKPEDYYMRNTKARLSSNVIVVDGKMTLAAVAKDINNPEAFAYDPATRTATTPHLIQISHKSTLTIGDKDDPAKGETLKIVSDAGRRGFHGLWGNLEIYNSRLVNCRISTRFEFPRVKIRNSEITDLDVAGALVASRSGGAPVFDIIGLDIHDSAAPLSCRGLRGPYINCKIHDNEALGWFAPTDYDLRKLADEENVPFVLIDCELYTNGDVPEGHGLWNWVYINTTDDNLDKYTFTTGALTRKWHFSLTAQTKAAKPMDQLDVWLDTEGDKHDEKGTTDKQGLCRLDATEYVKDKDGKHSYSYQIKVRTKAGEWQTVKDEWSLTENTQLSYKEAEGIK